MKELMLHERFEIETLDEMRKSRVLKSLVFGGGTMLRLCHQLPRFSVDLDFYIKNPNSDFEEAFELLNRHFQHLGIEITDKHKKHFTYLIEIRRPSSPRRLKIEIRKENKQARLIEPSIAFSPAVPDMQVAVTSCSLEQMATNKIEALIQRQLARDAYDLEFLIRHGVDIAKNIANTDREKALVVVQNMKPKDIKDTLGPLLPPIERQRIFKTGFSLLIGKLHSEINGVGRI